MERQKTFVKFFLKRIWFLTVVVALLGMVIGGLSCSSGGGGGNGSLTQMLYVLNSDGSVSVINPSAGTTVTTLSMGGSVQIASLTSGNLLDVFGMNTESNNTLTPLASAIYTFTTFGSSYGIAINPNTHLIYAENGNGDISVIDATTNKKVGTINAPINPNDQIGIAINPASNTAYVIDVMISNPPVYVINLNNNQVIQTISTQNINGSLAPVGIAVNPTQGGNVYISGGAGGGFFVVNPASNSVNYHPAVALSMGIAFDSNNNYLYITGFGGTLDAINTNNNYSIMGSWNIDSYGSLVPDIALNPSANTAYVTDYVSGTLLSVNLSNGNVIATTSLGSSCGPRQVAYDSTTNQIYVVCSGNGTIVAVNASTNTVSNTVNTPPGTTPVGIISTPGSPSAGTQSNATKPSPPTNLTATAGNGQVTLTWNASSGATSYDVYASTSPSSLKKVGSTTSTNYTVTGLTNGTLYYFMVIALNSNGESSSSEVSATPQAATTIPPAPTNLTVTAGNKQVTLSWNASTGATSYNVYDATVSGGPYTKVASTSNTSMTVTGLSNTGTTYYFVVTAVNSAGGSGYSMEVSSVAYITNTYAVGTNPGGVAIDASGNVWVTNCGSNTVTKLNSSGTTIGTYAVGSGPMGIAIDASGNVWVANGNSNNVTELSSTGTTIGTFPVGTEPWGIAIDASGNIWIANAGSGNVTELSSTGTIIGTFPVGSKPEGIAIDVFGNVLVTNTYGGNVTKLSSSGTTIGTFPVGSWPEGIAIDASGNVWVVNSSSNNVTELSSTGTTIGTFPVGSWPRCIAIDASGNVWVTNNHDNTVTELSSTGTTIGTYAVGASPVDIAIDSSGNLWIADQGSTNVTEIVGVAKGPQHFPYTGPQFPVGNI
ncbi:MAG: fibronectin type III domain-containing protein [Nitrososphaerota archaeon]